MRLSDLIQENHAASAIEILGLSADSRAVQPGYLFAALAGTERDGAAYIDSAIEHGAVAVLTAPDVSVPSKAVHVVVDNNPRRRLALLAARFYARQPRMIAAVTGTNGKTSVAWFVRQIWETLGYKAASIGTLGAIASGFPEQPSLTTPEPVTLHHTLSQFAEAGIDHAVLEASSHGLAQYRLDGVRISAAAFTNLTRDHLDYHRSEEEYFYAKKRLFAEVMPPGRTAVVNADSPYASDIEALCWARGNRIITYGESSKDLVLVAVKPHGLGQDMTVEYKGERYEIHLPLAGRFQAMNALASAGLVFATTGMPVERVFTALDALVLVVGAGYLMLVGYHLLPARVPARDDYLEEYEIQDYVTEVVVREDSAIVGETVATAIDEAVFDADILQITRDEETFFEGIDSKRIRVGDVLLLRTDRDTLATIAQLDGLDLTGMPRTEAEMEAGTRAEQSLVEVVIQSGSSLVGETLTTTSFRQRYDANVLAYRSRGETVRTRLDDIELRVGDTLLVQAPTDSIDRLSRNTDFIVAREPPEPSYRTEKTGWAIAIVVGVVALAAQPFVPVDIVVTALAGVVAMVVTGVLRPSELYDSVDWDVIFLLAGVIPLGIALQQTGAAALVGQVVATSADFLPLVGVLWVFYLVTGLVTSVVSNNASVVLMIPVAVDAANRLDASAYAFVLAVTFAASTAFISPIGYQTNLFVYGPGGYKFSDYVRVGAPLQLLLSFVTVAGIVTFWGLTPG